MREAVLVPDYSERHRQQRGKNRALMLVLVGLCILFFVITIVRMGKL